MTQHVNDRPLSSLERSFETSGSIYIMAIVRIKAKEEQLHEKVLRQALDLSYTITPSTPQFSYCWPTKQTSF